jgi:hypothetical protein
MLTYADCRIQFELIVLLIPLQVSLHYYIPSVLTPLFKLLCMCPSGVRELERKAQEHGLRVRYLPPPPKNADPDTLLIALTLLTT